MSTVIKETVENFEAKGRAFTRLAELEKKKNEIETKVKEYMDYLKVAQKDLSDIKEEYIKLWVIAHPEKVETTPRKTYTIHDANTVIACRELVAAIIKNAAEPIAMKEIIAMAKDKFDESLIARETRFVSKSGQHGVVMLGDKSGARYWKDTGERIEKPQQGVSKVIARNY